MSVRAAVEAVADLFRASADAKGVTLGLDIEPIGTSYRPGGLAAPQAGAFEPRRQRHQVHRDRGDQRQGDGRLHRDSGAHCVLRAGQRHRHRCGGPERAFPALPPGCLGAFQSPEGDRARAWRSASASSRPWVGRSGFPAPRAWARSSASTLVFELFERPDTQLLADSGRRRSTPSRSRSAAQFSSSRITR